ncbi:nuclear transport factor 2 family protein [Rudaea sp.]|uniref:nuclear transport factor 2 family protein n=1 Tax=Rudaea sp. TaxID=2136325 RepID=UPI00321FD623
MIRKSVYWPFVLSAAVAFSAWAAPAYIAAAENAHVTKPVDAAPTTDALLALEKQAHEAYIRGDGKFFENLLSDKWVAQQGGIRRSKADAVKGISGVRCEVGPGWALSEPRMLKIDKDAYVLSYESNLRGSCTENGKTEKLPDRARAATVWVRNGDRWQAVFHGENPIIDPSAPPSSDKKAEPGADAHTATDTNTGASAHNVTADPITGALMAAENAVSDAWRRHDAKTINELTANDIAFVDIYGTFTANKPATVKAWTSTLCNVSSFTLTNGVGTSVSPTVGIVTVTGSYVGTCGGQDISGQKIAENSVYVKVGGVWKWVFAFNSPM